jgi:Ca-activated chloride channel family protein
MIQRSSFLLVFLIIGLFTGSLCAQEDDIIKVDSSLVVINATITDATGKSVSSLKQNEFKLFENGKEQKISFFEAQTTPFAAVILIDTSGSMESRISLARSAAMNFLDGLRTDDVASIYNFDTKVSLVQEFSNSRDIAYSVFDLKAYGYTVLNDAIYQAAQELGKRDEKRRAIIVLSDGMDTKSGKSADKALKAALAVNATIYTVDMSRIDTGGKERMQNQGVLKNFAEKSGGKFIATAGGPAMREAFKNIVGELGTQYTLGFQPELNDGKWHSLEVVVARPNLQIRTRKGYNSQKAQ